MLHVSEGERQMIHAVSLPHSAYWQSSF